MNPQEFLVLIKGEIKTEEVETLSFDDASRKCKVVFVMVMLMNIALVMLFV